MQLLLRKLTSDSSGVEEYLDSEISAEEIVIGSAPQSDIQLLDSGIGGIHARLKIHGEKAVVQAEKGRTVLHNGKAAKQAELAAGDELRIGSQRFVCAEPVPGFDLALEWHFVEMPGHLLANAYRTSLADLNFSPRTLAWSLAIATFVLTGLLPVFAHFFNRVESPVHESLAISDFWSSGPLHSAHQVAIGNDCQACHQSAFVQVKDEACQQCHAEMTDHLSEQHPDLASFGELAIFDQFACQNCHKEHNEPQSIVASSDQLCRNCHQQLEPAIEGFSGEAHPPFALSLLQPEVQQVAGTLSVNWRSEKLTAAMSPQESNHLKYPHDVHLDMEAVRHPRRDDALQCADCHTLSSDREHFEPISMEKHCSSCHELSFDAQNPQKQLPHGSPQDVFDALEAHFVKQAFGDADDDGFTRRRLPGREWEESSCDRDYACARDQALREADRQFSQKGCITCHQVDELIGAEGVERWQVLPVRLNHDWYSDARFDHQSHLTQARQTGDALCLTCHKATTSEASSDILMPALAQCTDCHGDMSVSGRVAVNCIDCHGYHRSDAAPMSRIDLKLTGAANELLRGIANDEL